MKTIDPKNDIVLTPNYFADFICKMIGVENKNVIDNSAGAGSLLLSAIRHNAKKVIGVELSDLMFPLLEKELKESNGDSYLIKGDGLTFDYCFDEIDCLLSNPPYSASGKGLCFPEYVMRNMTHGIAAVLIMSSAGSDKEWTARILKHSTLKMSIKCPDVFKGFANVKTSLYIFECGVPHNESSMVKFLDFSNDGYKRSGRKTQKGKVEDIDNAEARYQEAIDLYNEAEPRMYGDSFVTDTVSLDGGGWNYDEHVKHDIKPTIDDFRKTVADYMEWQCKTHIEKTMGSDYVFTKLVVALGLDPRKL